jgi:hypothetical protein
MYESRGTLQKHFGELMRRWAELRREWDDPVARAFEQRFIAPIEPDLRNAMSGLDRMATVLAQLRRDCE